MAGQASKISGVVQIDGNPAQRTVRAFGYSQESHTIDGETVTLSKSLGQSTSDPDTGEYTIDLLAGYDKRIFVVAFDDYGADFLPNMTLAVGDRVHPTTPNGHVWECTGAGTLPSEEPTWVVDIETAQLYGTASMIAKPFYRPMVHGPVAPEVVVAVITAPTDGLVHFYTMDALENGEAVDEIGNYNLPLNGMAQTDGQFGQALSFNGVDDLVELSPTAFNGEQFAYTGVAKVSQEIGNFFLLCHRDDTQALIQLSVQDNEIVLQVRSSTSAIESGSITNTGNFFFFVFNFNKNGKCELFINNSLAVEFFTPTGDYSSQTSLIGPYSRDGVERIFDLAAPGIMDQVRVYDRILSPEEVDRLYKEGQPVGGADWTPANLFSNNEQGAWYDPSDLTTLFQDAGGTVPVENDGDPVGAMLDKSGNQNNALQSDPDARPTFRTFEGVSWLEFDGANDHLQVEGAAWINSATSLMVNMRAFIPLESRESSGGVISKSLGYDGNGYKGFNINHTSSTGMRIYGLGDLVNSAADPTQDFENEEVFSFKWLEGIELSVFSEGIEADAIQPQNEAIDSGAQPLTIGKLSYSESYKKFDFYGAVISLQTSEEKRQLIETYLRGN